MYNVLQDQDKNIFCLYYVLCGSYKRIIEKKNCTSVCHELSCAKFPDLGMRSSDFLTKNWPLTTLPTFLTYSRLIWQSFSY